jgi:long-chain fatty acid transport protein
VSTLTKSCHGQIQNVILIIGIWLTLLLPSPLLATGFRIFPQSASAAGQGNAFVAQSDDPAAIYYNPAGITQLHGFQLMSGTLLVGGETKFTSSATGAKSEGDLGGTISTPPPLHFYLTADLKRLADALDFNPLERVTVGVGLFTPFGLKIRWPGDGPLNTALTRASLPLIEVRPVIAVKVTEKLSLAVGADIYTFQDLIGDGKAKTQFKSSGAPGLPPAGTPLEVNGKDTAAGFNLSVRYTPCVADDNRSRCAFGFQYRNRASLRLDGEFLAAGMSVAGARTTLVLPQSFTFGAAAWPIQDKQHEWKAEIDFDKTDWSAFKNTDVHLSNGAVIRVPRNWKDTFSAMVGTEYKWLGPAVLDHWDVSARAGYLYSANAVPDQTFDPAVVDSNTHTVSIGLGLLCKSGGKFAGLIPCGDPVARYLPAAIGLDLAYQAAFYEVRRVTGNRPPLTFPAVVNGTYKTMQNLGLITMRVNF